MQKLINGVVMFDILKQGFSNAKLKLQGKAQISEAVIDEACVDIKTSLLEADVEFSVVKKFLSRVRQKALGEIVNVSIRHNNQKIRITPHDHFIKICQGELQDLMGPLDSSLNINGAKPTAIMAVGLQGSGKTTTCAKLAKFLTAQSKKVLLVAADTSRPAAREQLKTLGSQINVPVFTDLALPPVEIARQSIAYAQERAFDVIIIDTAGRVTIDTTLMNELTQIESAVKPQETLLVCDAMIGQESVTTARNFSERVSLTGFILTKLDGDTRGGAALSIKEVTGTPIKFIGIGESLTGLEEFRPEGFASRILGFGDIVSLVKDFEKVVDEKQAEEDAQKLLRGEFTLNDFLAQVKMIKNLGPIQDVFEKIPLMGNLPKGATVDDQEFVKAEALINSMTEVEREHPNMIIGKRLERIARGAGRKVYDVQELLRKYFMMRKMLGGIGSGIGGKLKGLRKLQKMTGLNLHGMKEEFKSINLPKPEVHILSDEEKRKLRNKKKRDKKKKR